MKILSAPTLSSIENCPYLEGESSRQEYFFAKDVKEDELDYLLDSGWRKFGLFFFRPNCPSCNKCISIRVCLNLFKASKSQRRNLRKNSDIKINLGPLIYKKLHYQLFVKHSQVRFSQSASEIESEELFLETHYGKSTSSLLAEYYLNNELVAVGYMDKAESSLSSVYFIYDPDHSSRGLGIFGALKEIELAKELGLRFYHLGYYIKENNFMNYKAQFKLFEILDNKTGKWIKGANEK